MRGLVFYYVLLIFKVHMHELFLWKIKKVLQLPMLFNESNSKPNKIWVDKGSEFYNRSMKLVLQDNDIEIY